MNGSAAKNGQNSDGGTKRSKKTNIIACPQDVVLAATTLALTLSKGRNQYEVETLINLLSLTTDNLQAILAQMLINRKVPDEFDIPI